MFWELFSLILTPGRGSLLALEGVLCLGFVECVIWICQMCDLDLDWEGLLCGKAKLSSRDQVGC